MRSRARAHVIRWARSSVPDWKRFAPPRPRAPVSWPVSLPTVSRVRLPAVLQIAFVANLISWFYFRIFLYPFYVIYCATVQAVGMVCELPLAARCACVVICLVSFTFSDCTAVAHALAATFLCAHVTCGGVNTCRRL